MTNVAELSVNGRSVVVPAVDIDGTLVVVTGRFPRIAAVKDESFSDAGVLQDPANFVRAVSESSLGADVITFAQPIDDPVAKHAYYYELDNVAAADTTSFTAWWDKLPQSTRKNCRRAEKRGVVTRSVSLDSDLALGIKAIYDETPVRQGRRFWHYGKDLEQVVRDNSSYPDRSEFVASYYQDQLIGFMKLVYVGRVARIMQLLSFASHNDKRPMNALIAKAIEVCQSRGMTHLVYSKFQYGNKIDTPLMEFKTRNGFNRLEFPRYYVATTFAGKVAIACRLHRGAIGLLPPVVLKRALSLRESLAQLNRRIRRSGATSGDASGVGDDD